MKNLPDKIYVNYKGFGVFDEPATIKMQASQIEYTRTDAFIEKACVKLKKLIYDNLMFQGRLHREDVIDNFVDDFKKYMEE